MTYPRRVKSYDKRRECPKKRKEKESGVRGRGGWGWGGWWGLIMVVEDCSFIEQICGGYFTLLESPVDQIKGRR